MLKLSWMKFLINLILLLDDIESRIFSALFFPRVMIFGNSSINDSGNLQNPPFLKLVLL